MATLALTKAKSGRFCVNRATSETSLHNLNISNLLKGHHKILSLSSGLHLTGRFSEKKISIILTGATLSPVFQAQITAHLQVLTPKGHHITCMGLPWAHPDFKAHQAQVSMAHQAQTLIIIMIGIQ
jgi:hypothetical protein